MKRCEGLEIARIHHHNLAVMLALCSYFAIREATANPYRQESSLALAW